MLAEPADVVRVVALHSTLAQRVEAALREALASSPIATHATDGTLALRLCRLDRQRLIVLGERFAPNLAALAGRDAGGAPTAPGYVSIARYYDVAACEAALAHTAEAMVDDFAPAVFARELTHWLDRNGGA